MRSPHTEILEVFLIARKYYHPSNGVNYQHYLAFFVVVALIKRKMVERRLFLMVCFTVLFLGKIMKYIYMQKYTLLIWINYKSVTCNSGRSWCNLKE